MPARTLFLSRLIGLFAVLVSLSLFIQRESIVEIVSVVLDGGPLQFFVGAFALIVGLAMVLGHNVWSGGALPVVITLIGWAALLKGVAFLILPSDVNAPVIDLARMAEDLYIYPVVLLVLGAWLTYAGFKSASRQAHR